MKPVLTIRYCTRCRWLMRSAWMAQECLSTFEEALEAVTLIPDPTGGVFQIHLGDKMLWDRVRDNGFPDVKALKQRVRDELEPERSLGHLDA